MPIDPLTSLSNVSLAGTPKTAVLTGATTGIGPGIARLLAKLGVSRIIILGRSELGAEKVMKEMRELAPKEGALKLEYVKGDLGNQAGQRAAADALAKTVGQRTVDYLIMTQGGNLTGVIVPNSEGEDQAFIVQAVSRFAISYLLIKSGCLAPNAIVLAVANPGQSLDTLTVEDLSLKKRSKEVSKRTLVMEMSKRDSSVIDGFMEELAIRYSEYSFAHIFPGVVNSNESGLPRKIPFPFPFNLLFWVALKLIGVTPDQFAPYAVSILTLPEVHPEPGHVRLYGAKAETRPMAKWQSDPANRLALWEKLKEMIDEK